MKTKLIDALLDTPSGAEIRKMLRLQSEAVHTEFLYARSGWGAAENPFCEVRACVVKMEGGELAQDAIEIVFRCLQVATLDWHSPFYDDEDRPRLGVAAIEIDEDCFRIVCAKVEVLSVELVKLGECFEK